MFSFMSSLDQVFGFPISSYRILSMCQTVFEDEINIQNLRQSATSFSLNISGSYPISEGLGRAQELTHLKWNLPAPVTVWANFL